MVSEQEVGVEQEVVEVHGVVAFATHHVFAVYVAHARVRWVSVSGAE